MPIASNDYEQLLNQARVKLTGVSDAALRGEFYDVLSEFLNDSSMWKQQITIAYQANVRAYPLNVPEGIILRLDGALDWGPVVPTINPPNPNVVPMPVLMQDVGTLLMKNTPNAAGYAQVQLVCNTKLPKDNKTAPDAPVTLLPIWHVGLLDGVLGKFMTSPNKSYFNMTLGTYHLKRFRDAIARARVSALRANTNGSQTWRFPQPFRTASQQSGVPAIGSASERSF